MNRGTQFLTAAIAAVLTFATLTITLGERTHANWQHRDGYRHGSHHDCGSHSSEEEGHKDTPSTGQKDEL